MLCSQISASRVSGCQAEMVGLATLDCADAEPGSLGFFRCQPCPPDLPAPPRLLATPQLALGAVARPGSLRRVLARGQHVALATWAWNVVPASGLVFPQTRVGGRKVGSPIWLWCSAGFEGDAHWPSSGASVGVPAGPGPFAKSEAVLLTIRLWGGMVPRPRRNRVL